MHSCVTSKNAKWCHLIWTTLYMWHCAQSKSFRDRAAANNMFLVVCSKPIIHDFSSNYIARPTVYALVAYIIR